MTDGGRYTKSGNKNVMTIYGNGETKSSIAP